MYTCNKQELWLIESLKSTLNISAQVYKNRMFKALLETKQCQINPDTEENSLSSARISKLVSINCQNEAYADRYLMSIAGSGALLIENKCFL